MSDTDALSASSNTSVVERFVLGFLDISSGLAADTLDRLRERTRPVVDKARRQAGSTFEDLAAGELVSYAVRSGVPEVLQRCNADDWLVTEAENVELPLQDENAARAAIEEFARLRAHTKTVIENAACQHAIAATQALSDALAAGPAGRADDLHTAAHNAGRVYGELVVAGAEDEAITQVTVAADRALAHRSS